MNLNNKPRVLVTGATGFLGSYVIEELLNHNYEAIAQGRNEKLLDKFKEQGLSTLKCDLADITAKILDLDFVVHCAGLSTIWGKWSDFRHANVEGTNKVIEFCLKSNVKRLIFVSSPSIYTSRHDHYNIKEEEVNTKNKLSLYIKSKIQAEQLVNSSQSRNLETVILRPRGIVGIGDPSIVPRLLKANNTFGIPLFNSGNNLIDLTCVENVAYAIRLSLESAKAKNKTYNISNDEPRKFIELNDKLFQSLNVKPKYIRRKVKILYFVAFVFEIIYKTFRISNEPPITRYSICTLGYSQTLDISRAKEDLSFTPKINLNKGIEKYGAHNRTNTY